MPQKALSNPNGAFGYTDLQTKLGYNTVDCVAGAAIAARVPVSITSTGTVATTATDGTAIIGVSLNAAAAGDIVQVITTGIAENMSAGGATTLGTPVIRSATTAGWVTSSATPVTATVVGFALGASASNTVDVWVLPGSNTSS